jgi:hypothetical protein
MEPPSLAHLDDGVGIGAHAVHFPPSLLASLALRDHEPECRVMMTGHFPLGAKGFKLSHAHFSGGIEE